MIKGLYQRYQQLAAQRTQRLTKLSQLITESKKDDLNQLVGLLSDSGVDTDIRTVARDLQELQVKTTSEGVYVLPDGAEIQHKRQRFKASFNNYALEVDNRVNFLVIKTQSRQEDSMARAIEDCFEERILGTLASRRTVFVIAKDDTVGNEALREIQYANRL